MADHSQHQRPQRPQQQQQRPPRVFYRVSASDSVSKEWYNHPATAPTVEAQKRRIYRWGDMWGILDGHDFSVEKRTVVHQSEAYQVERCELQAVYVPLRVDDIWEEEVLCLPNIEFNGLLTIVGNAGTIRECLRMHGLPTLEYELTELAEVVPAAAPIQRSIHSNGNMQRDLIRKQYPAGMKHDGGGGHGGHGGRGGGGGGHGGGRGGSSNAAKSNRQYRPSY
jgi:uncharacterized membrane protein YgcG